MINHIIESLSCEEFQSDVDTAFALAGYAMAGRLTGCGTGIVGRGLMYCLSQPTGCRYQQPPDSAT